MIAAAYLTELRQACVRSLVLGCTHYPLLKPLLQRVMGPEVRLIDSGQATAAALETILVQKNLHASAQAEARHRFVVSDDEARFRQVGARFIGERLGRAEVISLG
jgi:glutamate racemase